MGGSVSIDFYKIFIIDNNYHFRLSVLLYQHIIDNDFQLAIDMSTLLVIHIDNDNQGCDALIYKASN